MKIINRLIRRIFKQQNYVSEIDLFLHKTRLEGLNHTKGYKAKVKYYQSLSQQRDNVRS